MKNDSDYGIYGFGTNSTFIEKTFCDFSKILLDNIEDWKIVTNNSEGILISELEAHDIDNESDWKLAELEFYLVK